MSSKGISKCTMGSMALLGKYGTQCPSLPGHCTAHSPVAGCRHCFFTGFFFPFPYTKSGIGRAAWPITQPMPSRMEPATCFFLGGGVGVAICSGRRLCEALLSAVLRQFDGGRQAFLVSMPCGSRLWIACRQQCGAVRRVLFL